MTGYVAKEVDVMAIAEFFGSEISFEKPEAEKKDSPKSFADYAKPLEKYLYSQEKENLQDENSGSLNDFTTNQIPEKKKAASYFEGFKATVKQNPILSIVAGAVLIGGAIMLYKNIFKADENKEASQRDRLKRKRKLKMRMIPEISKIKGESLPEADSGISEIPSKDEKEEIISGKTLGMSVAAIVTGTIAGTALGNYSLITAIPLAIFGIKKRNTNISIMAAGMALANGYKNESNEGNFIERAFSRVKQFFISLFDKLLFFKKEDEKVPEGYYRTMLGLMPIGI